MGTCLEMLLTCGSCVWGVQKLKEAYGWHARTEFRFFLREGLQLGLHPEGSPVPLALSKCLLAELTGVVCNGPQVEGHRFWVRSPVLLWYWTVMIHQDGAFLLVSPGNSGETSIASVSTWESLISITSPRVATVVSEIHGISGCHFSALGDHTLCSSSSA